MKYVVTWKPRAGGSAADNESSAARFLSLANSWAAGANTTIHQYVLRIDGEGGFAVIESDNASDVASTIFKFAPLVQYTAYPVVDAEEGFRVAGEAHEFRQSVR